MQKKFLGKKKTLYFASVDLEKAFDRVPRDIVLWALHKLGEREWLLKIVQAMYIKAQSHVRNTSTFSDSFCVKVGVHQGFALSPLLFICVLRALLREFQAGCPEEMLYADELVLPSDTMEGLILKLKTWKKAVESNGLKVNVPKTKVMISGCSIGKPQKKGKFPCSLCGKGVGSNSIFCGTCKHWVHKKCSGITGMLRDDNQFKCKRCKTTKTAENSNMEKVFLDGQAIEVVQRFCYLGDMIKAQGRAGPGVIARVRSGWSKFRELCHY